MKTIAVMNVKGGVGKTMTACNMAHILASDYNQRVLLVDADPSGNASAFFNISAEDAGLTELLQGSTLSYTEIVQETDWPRLHVLPCDSSLFPSSLPSASTVSTRLTKRFWSFAGKSRRTTPMILSSSTARRPLRPRPSPRCAPPTA